MYSPQAITHTKSLVTHGNCYFKSVSADELECCTVLKEDAVANGSDL